MILKTENNIKSYKYLELLLKQFQEATGYKNSTIDRLEFVDWIRSRQNDSANYLDLLEQMGYGVYDFASAVEIGKGSFDSIAIPFDATIITPYSEGIIVPKKSRLITSGFQVSKIGRIHMTPSVEILCETIFMTHNPYTQAHLRNWEHLVNNGHDIIVGMFGSTYDADMKSKIYQLRELKEKLPYDSCVDEEFTTMGDTYCYALAAINPKPKVKELIKRL